MILTGALTIAGVITTRPPAEAVWLAQFFIGMMVGVKYTGITLEEVRNDIFYGSSFAVIILCIVIILISGIHVFDLAPLQDAIMAFTPGGQAELIVLSIIIGADLPFVIAHHVLRMVSVIFAAPIFARIFKIG